jgi:EmrB/QacA subfamily drug resistance transporter
MGSLGAMALDARKRWIALMVLCFGDLMIVLDTTIVNVALPSIRDDLGFSQASLAWVVNAYLLTFGGFLLLGGRLGDLFGHRRLFLIGLTIFTAASLVCGLSTSQGMLVASRAVQGVGGAIVSVVVLSLLMIMFTEPAERAKAMGTVGFVLSGGGTAGVLLGGILTDILSWHWIFLVNIPIGIAVFVACVYLLPKDVRGEERPRLDIAGAVTVTLSLLLAVYAIVNGNEKGWTSGQTLGLLGAALALMIAFLVIESRVADPLVPLRLFKHRNLSVANGVGILMPAAMFGWFFFSALYLQLILGYSPLEVGFAFLPSTLVWGASSLWLSDKLIMRLGIKTPMLIGFSLFVIGLLLYARVPVDGNYFMDVFPGMIIMGFAGGITFNPILLAAMGDVEPTEAGLASGIVNTSFMMGGALGLAILAAAAASRTDSLIASGDSQLDALIGGYHLAFLLGALFAAAAAVLAAALLKPQPMQAHAGAEGMGEPAPAQAD